MTTENTTVDLPAELAEQCERRIEGTEFETVEEYVRFVMSVVVDEEGSDPDRDATEGSDEESVASHVEDRLSSLGYR